MDMSKSKQSVEAKTSSDKNKQNRIGPEGKEMRSNVKLYFIFGLSVILFIGGITVGVLWGSIFETILNNELTLTQTSQTFKIWDVNPIPIYLSFYLFNWTNPHEFNCHDCPKPNFTEHGPYVFSEMDYKVDKVWNKNGTITFHRRRFWTFEPSMSNGTLSDKITNLNPIAVTVGYIVRFQKPLMKKFASLLMNAVNENMIITRNISQLIFDGFDDKLLYIARKLNITSIPYDKFGWFYGRNGSETYEGTYSIKTGETSLFDVGQLVEWNYSNKTIYDNGKCSEIKGTVGDLWHPFTSNKNSTLFVFSSDICTTLNLVYGNTTELLGLIGTKFVSHENILDNGSKDPSRKCYCDNVACQPSGVLNVSLCKFGAPAFISLPHFYLGDSSYRDSIDGMFPEQEKHETYVVLDPIMGTPMQVKAQLQLNLFIQHDDKIDMFRGINNTYVPMLWFSQTATLTSEYATLVKFMHILPLLGYVVFYGIGCIGVLIFFIGIFITLKARWREEENQNLLPSDRNNSSVITSEG
ncbi:protein croquemort-like isoform X2 [Belonocnema kinseyi]|uniref:protein croquemort-like isoform X2 n=1 Tax=Belonocnema kinseyi TaxID=2817044 RepID=UPI00143D72FF|nr:protein croquemort-like isoform X2 [Belonocnema kinseyi]